MAAENPANEVLNTVTQWVGGLAPQEPWDSATSPAAMILYLAAVRPADVLRALHRCIDTTITALCVSTAGDLSQVPLMLDVLLERANGAADREFMFEQFRSFSERGLRFEFIGEATQDAIYTAMTMALGAAVAIAYDKKVMTSLALTSVRTLNIINGNSAAVICDYIRSAVPSVRKQYVPFTE